MPTAHVRPSAFKGFKTEQILGSPQLFLCPASSGPSYSWGSGSALAGQECRVSLPVREPTPTAPPHLLRKLLLPREVQLKARFFSSGLCDHPCHPPVSYQPLPLCHLSAFLTYAMAESLNLSAIDILDQIIPRCGREYCEL